MDFRDLVFGAVDGLGEIAPDHLDRVSRLADEYEEIASRAGAEISMLASLSLTEGARLWRTLLAGGLRTSRVLREAADHPDIDLESWVLVHDASARIAGATDRLIQLSADRIEARS